MPELKGLDIDADFIKEDVNLEEKFGKDIIGLTNENIEKLKEFIKPIILLNLKKELGLI